MQIRAVIFAIGIMIAILGVAMLPSALLDIADGSDQWPIFLVSSAISVLIGLGLGVLSGGAPSSTSAREAFLLTVLIWVVLPLIATIPFISYGLSFTDAFFETVSGMTTTGATVMTGLDTTSRGILLWRAILQWIGGIGIIVTAIVILPMLKVGGMQLFQIESSDMSGKFLPRINEIAMQTSIAYLLVSVLCAISYAACGMTAFDAITHSMTTMSAGGFSTHDASFGYFSDTPAAYAATFFMFVAGLPFALVTLMILHGRWRPMFSDPQPRLYFWLAVGFATVIVIWHEAVVDPPIFDHIFHGFRTALFNIISIMTGTGYASAPYDTWGQPATVIFLVATFLGGCAGSAACGIKMFRLEISFKAVFAYAAQIVRPNRVVRVRYAGRTVPSETLQSVMVFVFLYMATFVTGAVLISMTGEDLMTAISASATTVSNVGPGLGPVVGPSTTFQSLTDVAKWVCITAMLLGRLEFVAVFTILTARFWRG
ncbi:TrkH family potassium uptake protein [Henriciella aquimarina]|uniref:TrkH family potassium uptake protein n=1 Tax=Henriciella aquimarina TaxID=545261 RepID=UPI001F3C5A1A|nr:TrkH family potassium uptake protein [Henriciella aquimarina]